MLLLRCAGLNFTRMLRGLQELARRVTKYPLETISLCLVFSCVSYLTLVHILPTVEFKTARPLRVLVRGSEAVATDTVESLSYLLAKNHYKPPNHHNLYVRQLVVSVPKFPVIIPPQGRSRQSKIYIKAFLLSRSSDLYLTCSWQLKRSACLTQTATKTL